MNLADYALGVDVWEGSLDIDENLLKANGVEFIIIRLNHISGTLHLDDNFLRQWEQSMAFGRGAYYVESPAYPLSDQLHFLDDNVPPECEVVCPDLELRGLTASLIVDINQGLRARGKRVMDYSGGWCQEFLTLPVGEDYWWARYPGYLYPASTTPIEWAAFKNRLDDLAWEPGSAPGKIVCWQCTADRYVLPGCAGRAIDINLMPRADYERIFCPNPLAKRVELLESDNLLQQELLDKQAQEIALLAGRIQALETWAAGAKPGYVVNIPFVVK